MIVGSHPDTGARVDQGAIPVPTIMIVRKHSAITIGAHYRCDFIDHHSPLRHGVRIDYGTFLINTTGRTQRVAVWCKTFST